MAYRPLPPPSSLPPPPPSSHHIVGLRGDVTRKASPCFLSTEPLIRQREDGIRIFLQELSSQHFNEDDVILDLNTTLNELTKTHLANPPQVIDLQDLSELNRKALEKAQASRQNGVSHESIHVKFSDWTPSHSASPSESLVYESLKHTHTHTLHWYNTNFNRSGNIV